MKTVSAIAIAAALYGGAQLMRAPADPPVDSIVVGSIGAPEPNTYRLVANGTEAECVVSRGADISVGHSGTVARLVVAPECGRVLPGMDKAAFWMDREDGTVAFSADGRHDIVSFAVADGDGYESFRPRLPLIALKPR